MVRKLSKGRNRSSRLWAFLFIASMGSMDPDEGQGPWVLCNFSAGPTARRVACANCQLIWKEATSKCIQPPSLLSSFSLPLQQQSKRWQRGTMTWRLCAPMGLVVSEQCALMRCRWYELFLWLIHLYQIVVVSMLLSLAVDLSGILFLIRSERGLSIAYGALLLPCISCDVAVWNLILHAFGSLGRSQ